MLPRDAITENINEHFMHQNWNINYLNIYIRKFGGVLSHKICILNGSEFSLRTNRDIHTIELQTVMKSMKVQWDQLAPLIGFLEAPLKLY